MKSGSVLSLIAAATYPGRVIGKDNSLLWRIPSDMRRFRDITNCHPVIMGRLTWESINPKYRPLLGRTNIVVTRNKLYSASGAVVANSLAEALIVAREASGMEEIFCIGGGLLYREAINFADRIYLTKVYADIAGDAKFPEIDSNWEITNDSEPSCCADDEYTTSFQIYRRKTS
ncbi:hypothetical protein A3C89_02415 [Candidatus Kaiserbacteria bacterium RIFCSPHIGHO2_02_FULL_50_50]|uniref:Dihydrofolate reductase n=1 Tax=Candidatus Kaiserbacteria bacterium RIFCSPHIGHO2_02_FULL_50_50 TaxID=1798492 RepID=A0A1F6DDD4_9BACT|nr:MAG: hypothetical protein A3C89_02415 [Candidatus Kaiserbacteria bacterium RIFCSPHIGHO2_02_FULL_50_50]OGG88200.1 MAG: hypothetical protein A3G62_00390 [Candidatus Kaiserbacteria bacterium RIFCSPLOWO2_12_FULL_50_10]